MKRIYLLVCMLAACASIINSDPITTTVAPTTTAGPTTTAPPTTVTTTTTTTTEPSSSDGKECLLSKSSDNEKKLLDRINKLMKGRKYDWSDDDHQYYFSICETAEHAGGKSDGFIQINKKSQKTVVIGRLDDVDLESVENIIRMSYNGGDNYPNACNRSKRNAVVYFVCDPKQTKDEFKMLEENNAKDTNCAYIFELKTSSICTDNNDSNSTTTTTTTTTSAATTTKSSNDSSSTVSSTTGANPASTTTPSDKHTSKIGIFSIIMIALASVFVIYMSVGTMYLRFVNRARGWEQIPHINVWQGVGGRLADCCNYVCRCGQRQTEVHSYENINDRISDDENLLNM